MTESPDLKSRLLASDSVASLRAEQEVVAAFQKLPWWTVEHGPLFRDVETEKFRELDVRARRVWSQGREMDLNADLEVFVEVKSLRGYHVVFAPEPNGYKDSRAVSSWFGYSKERVRNVLTGLEMSPALCAQSLKALGELGYPDGTMLVGNLVIEPPTAPVFATAFRETNIGSAKDLDSSVIWKAIQGLGAAVASARKFWDDFHASNLKGTVEFIGPEEDVLLAIAKELDRAVRSVRLFHPVIVVDAGMWVSMPGGLEEAEHVRFMVGDPRDWPMPWCDVVTRSSFNRWLNQVTTHYSSRLEHPEEPLWRKNGEKLDELFRAVIDPSVDLEVTITKQDSSEPPKTFSKRSKQPRKLPGARPVRIK